MLLDDRPILARKLAAQKQSDALLDLCQRACPGIAAQFAPFEKYCGAVNVFAALTSHDSAQITAGFSYRQPHGPRLAFTVTVRRRGDDLVLVDRRGSAPIAVPEPSCIALEFLDSVERQAEAAFEAVVLDEPWRLRQIFR